MILTERLKSFIYKDKFDYSKEQINPYEYHKTFYYLARIFRVIDNEPIPKWTIMVPIVVCVAGFIAATLSCMAMVQAISIFEVPLITESGTYFIIMVYKLLIISCTITDGPYYSNFLQALRDDFKYICTDGIKYKEKYFECHLWTWKASLVASVFIGIIGGGIAVCAVIALIYFQTAPTEDSTRPLPFPFWFFDLDFFVTPIYEITFMFSILCVFTHTYTYIFMMQTQIVWIRQVTSKADVIIWSIEDLLIDVQPTNDVRQKEYYDEIIKSRMRKIIKMHHSMYRLLDDYAGVYKKLLMFEQKLCAPVVCLTAYCAAEKLDAGEVPGILVLLCTSVIILVFIPSYMCTVLAEKVQSVGDACWNTPFWNAPAKVIRPYLVLIMQRSLRPLPIQAPGFEDVSLQTFSNKMTFAYSCFNMLRQADYDI